MPPEHDLVSSCRCCCATLRRVPIARRQRPDEGLDAPRHMRRVDGHAIHRAGEEEEEKRRSPFAGVQKGRGGGGEIYIYRGKCDNPPPRSTLTQMLPINIGLPVVDGPAESSRLATANCLLQSRQQQQQ